uniref:G-protein coupled receptors family 1 profile domain-containing protein n=1 Tax=Acrobeloides nanus TaxID=290746 RepID=A0A914CZG5_9BILA
MDLNSIYPSEQQDDVTNSSLPWETPNDNIGALIVPTFILFGICGIGVIGNFCLAWVTFKGRNFRSNCYTFIVLNAMSSIVMELWSLSYIHYAINAKYYTTLECRAIGIVPTYCMNISIMLTVMTSADRLFVMVAPKKYLSFSRLTYLIITIAIPIITSAYWAFLSYSNSTEHKDIPHNRKYHIFQWEGPNPMESTQSKRTESNKPAICVFHNYIKDDVAVAHAIFNFVISFGLLLAHCYLCNFCYNKEDC